MPQPRDSKGRFSKCVSCEYVKELDDCKEEIRSRDQICDVVIGLACVLIEFTVVYAIFDLAMKGANATYPYPNVVLVTTLVFAASVLWVFLVARFPCYDPILGDAQLGFEQIAVKIKGAIKGWRNP